MIARYTFGSLALVLGPEDGGQVKIELRGGPLDGQRRRAPAEFCGVLCYRRRPDDTCIDDRLQWWYSRTSERTRTGRIVCRYGG